MLCEYDYTIKTLLIGDTCVGKSSIMNQFIYQQFEENYVSTVGVDYKTIPIRIDKYICKILLWDTAGQERFRTISKIYYRGAQAIIYVYDITSRKSFDNLISWMKEVEEVAPDNLIKILVGNKTDLDSGRVIGIEEAREFASNYGFKYFFEISAKTNYSIDKVFLSLASGIIEMSTKYQSNTQSNTQSNAKSKILNLDSKSIKKNNLTKSSSNWKRYFCFW